MLTICIHVLSCRFVLLKLGTSLIHISLYFNCNTDLWHLTFTLYHHNIVLLASYRPIFHRRFWLSATRPLYLITFHNKPLLSLFLHFVSPYFIITNKIYSIHHKFALVTNKNKITSILHCIVVCHMVYLTNCQRTLILVALLGFEPRLFAFKVRCVANSTKEQYWLRWVGFEPTIFSLWGWRDNRFSTPQYKRSTKGG